MYLVMRLRTSMNRRHIPHGGLRILPYPVPLLALRVKLPTCRLPRLLGKVYDLHGTVGDDLIL